MTRRTDFSALSGCELISLTATSLSGDGQAFLRPASTQRFVHRNRTHLLSAPAASGDGAMDPLPHFILFKAGGRRLPRPSKVRLEELEPGYQSRTIVAPKPPASGGDRHVSKTMSEPTCDICVAHRSFSMNDTTLRNPSVTCSRYSSPRFARLWVDGLIRGRPDFDVTGPEGSYGCVAPHRWEVVKIDRLASATLLSNQNVSFLIFIRFGAPVVLLLSPNKSVVPKSMCHALMSFRFSSSRPVPRVRTNCLSISKAARPLRDSVEVIKASTMRARRCA